MIKQQSLAVPAILLATLFWGMTFAFIKDAVAMMDPFNFLFWRFAIASILLLVFFWKKIVINKTTLKQSAILGLLLGGTVFFQTIGLRDITAATSSFITGFSVILVAIFESLLNKKFPSFYVIISSFLAVIGIGLVTVSDGIIINQGDFWTLLCAFCFAAYILYVEKISETSQTISLTFLQSVFICLFAVLICQFITKITIPTHFNVWAAIIFCAVFASIIAFMLQLQFQQFVSPTKAAIIFALEPVFATIMAAIYLGERLNLMFFLGALLIFLGIIISEKRIKIKVIPQD